MGTCLKKGMVGTSPTEEAEVLTVKRGNSKQQSWDLRFLKDFIILFSNIRNTTTWKWMGTWMKKWLSSLGKQDVQPRTLRARAGGENKEGPYSYDGNTKFERTFCRGVRNMKDELENEQTTLSSRPITLPETGDTWFNVVLKVWNLEISLTSHFRWSKLLWPS